MTMIFLNSIIIVGIWMCIIQLYRYVLHSKMHDEDDPDAKAYKLAHKPSTIYWTIPALFVVVAALSGQVIGSILEEFLPVEDKAAYVTAAASILTYMAMDIQYGNKSIIAKLCDTLYYLFVEKNFDKARPEIMALRKRIDELRTHCSDEEFETLQSQIEKLNK